MSITGSQAVLSFINEIVSARYQLERQMFERKIGTSVQRNVYFANPIK